MCLGIFYACVAEGGQRPAPTRSATFLLQAHRPHEGDKAAPTSGCVNMAE